MKLLAVLALAALSPACTLREGAAVGERAPGLRLERLDDGSSVSLADLRGQVVLLEFWRTWCAPCLAAVPHLNELHALYGGEGLAVLGVTNEDESKVRLTAERVGMAYPVVLTPGDAADDAYGIQGFPTTVIVDREGVLAWRGHPMELEAPVLAELLRR